MSTHGTRSYYQATGCTCRPCRAANAAYETGYRDRKRRGLPILGSVVSAVETWRQLRLLTTEYDTKIRTVNGERVVYGGQAALARRLGFRDRHLQFRRKRVRPETAAKICRIYQLDILEAPYVDDGSAA